MSRYTITADVIVASKRIFNATVSYGFDHACGYFIQVFDPVDPDSLILDKDSFFDGMNKTGMLETFIAMEIKEMIPDTHIEAITLDLPIP
ncbi:MAG: hypothetical protein KGD60_15115 [Candidatus Thorarchaeota archaeon]|nr:hypothetical protein [Candidatus Thorarchaeota archaeon]